MEDFENVGQTIEVPDTVTLERSPKKETTENQKKVATEGPKKTRTVEELLGAGMRGMSESEKIRLIGHLKTEVFTKENQLKALQSSCETAYKNLREKEEQLANIIKSANQKLTLVYSLVDTNANAIKTILE